MTISLRRFCAFSRTSIGVICVLQTIYACNPPSLLPARRLPSLLYFPPPPPPRLFLSAMDRWVILENSHLAGDWMPSLCRLVQALPLLKPHQNFRLWLTTVPTSAYPDIILQSSLKLVMDPPHGIKANLLQVGLSCAGVI